jgi:sugar phosphate isomerase/epimerase
VRPLLPTGSVTREPDLVDHRRIAQHIPPVELELSISQYWDERVVHDLAGLPIVTAHAVKSIGATLSGDEPALGRFALDCRIAAELGARLVVLHLWELPDGDRYLERNLARLPALLDLAEEHGLTLAVETVPCSAGRPIDNVVRACERDERCRVTLDTEFLGLHGQLDAALEIAEVVAHVHAKDFRPDVWGTKPRRYFLPGEGVLDIPGFLERLRYDGTVTLEFSALTGDGTVDTARLEDGVAWLHRLAS